MCVNVTWYWRMEEVERKTPPRPPVAKNVSLYEQRLLPNPHTCFESNFYNLFTVKSSRYMAFGAEFEMNLIKSRKRKSSVPRESNRPTGLTNFVTRISCMWPNSTEWKELRTRGKLSLLVAQFDADLPLKQVSPYCEPKPVRQFEQARNFMICLYLPPSRRHGASSGCGRRNGLQCVA